MKLNRILTALAAVLAVPAAVAGVYPQCPFPITNSTLFELDPASGMKMYYRNVASSPNVPTPHRQVCLHVAAGDGYMLLGNGARAYGFGFSPAVGVDEDVMRSGLLAAQFPAPTITFKEGDEVWLSLTNVGMINRPDLFDQHSVHWHGYPNASAIFDGVPQASATVQMGSTFTYYYKVNDPGSYMWHCHVEATEHMEMGMLGMLNVQPRQNGTPFTYAGKALSKYAYNDGNGETGFDREFTLQFGGVDSNFHDLHEKVQPLPFLELKADFAQVNGRGYPMTTFKTGMAAPADAPGLSQPVHSVIEATQGERLLLRLTNLGVDTYYTVTALGLPMRIVGRGAAIARGPGGASWSHGTGSVTLGGGDGVELIVDTAGVAKGTYYLYTTNLNLLSNGAQEDRGGLMTTIVVQ